MTFCFMYQAGFIVLGFVLLLLATRTPSRRKNTRDHASASGTIGVPKLREWDPTPVEQVFPH